MQKIKIGKRRIELALRHWKIADVCDGIKKQNYKGCHFDKAYGKRETDFGIVEEELPNKVGIYVRDTAADISSYRRNKEV